MTKVLISIDDKLLAQLDEAARCEGLTRSAYISRLAENHTAEVSRERRAKISEALRAADELFARNPTPGDITDLIRQDRDSH